jgi:hypothetical protein
MLCISFSSFEMMGNYDVFDLICNPAHRAVVEEVVEEFPVVMVEETPAPTPEPLQAPITPKAVCQMRFISA